MHEVSLVLQSSFNEHNPVSRFHAYMSLSFSFRYIIHIPSGVMYHTIYRISCHTIHSVTFQYSYNKPWSYKGHTSSHAFISHQLSSINNIHSRSHDFVRKHNNLAYNVSYHNHADSKVTYLASLNRCHVYILTESSIPSFEIQVNLCDPITSVSSLNSIQLFL